MSAYVIAEVTVNDAALFAEYGKGVPASIAAYGGKYLVRGGATEPKEGGWEPKRMVVLEFPTMAQARKWYDSAEYKPLLAMRLKAPNASMIFVEGMPG